ncbi:MAG: MmgE/PrpD family protein [Deltaproteobacteria bacterium]|nr:MmgE/PrpD family protein [Deltaproteobacteria bacterium]
MDIDVTGQLASYIARSGDTELPPAVVAKAKHHILDSLTAVIFGSSLKPGRLAIEFIKSQGGIEEARVAGSSIRTTAINAALANGIMGHAAEIDDYHSPSLTHAGIAVFPAALAAAEREGAGGSRLIRGVVAGYDMACRVTHAMGIDSFARLGLSSHSVSGTFGAAVAAASIMGLDEQQVRYTLSYAVQQASGSLNWIRDEQHVEKAFAYGGMPARNGVTAAIFAQMGFPAVHDPFVGRPNYLYFFTHDVNKPKVLIDGLGSRFYIMENVIKKYAVGGPIQGPLDGLLMLMEKHHFTAKDVAAMTVSLSDEAMRVVDDSDMPNVNLQYNLATALCDGKSTYASTISYERMNDPVIVALRKRIRVVHEPAFDELRKRRYAVLEVSLKDGVQWCEQIKAIRGSAANPMNTVEVEAKAAQYIGAVLGEDRARTLIEKIRDLEAIGDVRELRDDIARG